MFPVLGRPVGAVVTATPPYWFSRRATSSAALFRPLRKNARKARSAEAASAAATSDAGFTAMVSRRRAS